MIYPKCLICNHKKRDHFEGTDKLNEVCFECTEMYLYGDNSRHKYVPDNLGYIERIAKTRKLI